MYKYNLAKIFFFGFIFQSNLLFSQNDSVIEQTLLLEEETYIEPIRTFESTRIINGHSVENLRKGVLEFRIEHRFGDIAGSNGGAQNWFGFDNASDIRMAFEYGVTDKFMVGLGRSKGNGNPYRSLLDAFGKYRLMHQSSTTPFSLSANGTVTYTYQKASDDISSVNYYPKQVHRLAYAAQLNVARKFGESFSLALMPTVVHRNYVAADDQNTVFSVGGAMRWSITSKIGVLAEYYHCFNQANLRTGNENSLGFAVEWITFGHNFTVYLTNSSGFTETQFITNTTEKWSKGQFRLGFCIGRKFEKG
jgi:hypothetical protein